MSVICKVYITGTKVLGGNKLLVHTNCIAENEVMAAYNPSHEDKLFSQYSPSGQADFIVDDTVPIPQGLGLDQSRLYLVFVQGDRPAFAKALALASCQVVSKTIFSGKSEQFEIRANYNRDVVYPQTSNFVHRIMIDNPAAANQFVPGDEDWWVGIYDAEKMTMEQVLADAHA